MKTIKRSFRVWSGVLIILGGVLGLAAIWADPIPTGGPGSPQQKVDNCKANYEDCMQACHEAWLSGSCEQDCEIHEINCFATIRTSAIGVGAVPGQSPPPNAVNPISSPSPTPRNYPIKGPPHKLGPNSTPSPSPTPRKHPTKPPRRLGPSPSPTGNPILLAKPTSPTPSPHSGPKKTSSHGHH